MNVQELMQLANWVEAVIPTRGQNYEALLNLLQHNASQPNKQAIEEELSTLLSSLRATNFDELSLQQLKMLESLGVRKYLGEEGATFVESTIQTSNYDPATAVSKIQDAINATNRAVAGLAAYQSALRQLDIKPEEFENIDNHIVIRVGFQNEAAIDNVTDWKESAKDWYDIIRGLALAANEGVYPLDVRMI
jgi:hypothetical protein